MQNNYQIHFAPLQGYTDAIYRNAHARIFGGVDMYYTPFVRIERGEFRSRDLRDIHPDKNEAPLIPQLMAGSADELRRIAALFVEKGYTHADINMGCPFPLLARKRKGSGILAHPDLVQEMLQSIQDIPELKFSVKLRLGWEQADEALALLPLLQQLPIEQIAVHARLGIQQYKGSVDMDAFERFYDACELPLFYNGDLNSAAEIQAIYTRFPKLKGVMLGRGLLGHPEMAAEASTGVLLTSDEKRTRLKEFHNELFNSYSELLQGDSQLLTKLKTIWEYLLPDADRKLKKKIAKSNKVALYTDAVRVLLNEYTEDV